MKSLLALACILLPLLAAPVLAADLTVDCTPPTKNTDGSTITGAITFNLYGALQGQAKQLLTPTPLASCHSVRQNVNPGTQCYEATAIVGGVESDHSAESCKSISAPKPQPPGAPVLTLSTTSTVAYQLVPGVDTYAPLIVGSVPLGTPCDASKPLLGYYIVPRAAVTFTGPIKQTPAVVARCG